MTAAAGTTKTSERPRSVDTIVFSPSSVDQLTSADAAMETRNQLMYDFSSPEKVDVYFDPPSDAEERSSEEVLANLRFLNSLRPDTLLMSDHPDGPDEYSGKVDIEAPHAFLTTWGVSGPFQEGQVISMFTREDVALKSEF